jgi:cell division protease FtsH
VKVYEIKFNTLLFPVLFLIGLFAVGYIYRGYTATEKIIPNKEIGLNQIVENYGSGVYEEIVIQGTTLEARMRPTENVVNGQIVTERKVDITLVPENLEITDIGLANPENPTKVTIKEQSWTSVLADSILSILGTIIFIIFLFFMMTRMGGGGMGSPMAFIKSRARMYDPENDEQVTFADVAGADEEKADLIEIVDFLKSPQKYKDLGAKIPRGILLQ